LYAGLFIDLLIIYPSLHLIDIVTLASTSTTTTGLIAWSAFEADKLCLGDFASSSNVWLSDYESDASKMRQCLFILCELCACPAILFSLIV
jgi:hypothetical protein